MAMESWVAIFVIVACVAIIMQALILAGMFLAMKKTSEHVIRVSSEINTKLLPVLEKTNFLLEDSRQRFSSVVADTAEIVHVARNQANRFDRVMAEGLELLRTQIVRADTVITGVLESLEEAHTNVRKTVAGPVAQVAAVIRGLKAGLDIFTGGKTARGERSRAQSSEEELFI
jgi:type IV secretory pathway VirB2 component (pilin)